MPLPYTASRGVHAGTTGQTAHRYSRVNHKLRPQRRLVDGGQWSKPVPFMHLPSLRWNPLKHPWPTWVVVIVLVLGSMLSITVILATVGWNSSKKVLLETSVRAARNTGALVSERSQHLLEPGKASLRVLALDPVVDATTTAQRLRRVPIFASELTANPLISSIYVAYPNQDFLLVRSLAQHQIRAQYHAPPQADFLVVTMGTEGQEQFQGRRHTDYYFLDAQGTTVEYRPDQPLRIDPFTRPWYHSAQTSDTIQVTRPYVFTSTQQLGFTLSLQARSGGAVLGLDIALDDLARSLDELRPTPESELALIDQRGAVLAYHDMDKIVLSHSKQEIEFQPIAGLGVEALTALYASGQQDQAISYHVRGREWLGLALPFKALEGARLRLLIATPTDALLGELEQERNQLLGVAVAVMLAFLPLGWWGGRSIGLSLQRIAAQARQLSHFNFSPPQRNPTVLQEVKTLTNVIDNVANTVESFLSISQVLGSETEVDALLSQVLQELVKATRSLGGAVYLLQPDSQIMAKVSADGVQDALPTQFTDSAQYPVCNQPLRVDAQRQQIAFAINCRDGQQQGFLVLLYADNTAHRTPQFWDFASKLTGMLSIALETRQLMEAQKQLFDAIIHVLADAIDAKSPYTGGHCERVPQLALQLADQMASDTQGPYADFQWTADERYAFYLGAWLHDCGKVTSPEHIVDKATKLEVIYNRIHEIRMRFEVLWRDADIRYLQALHAGHDVQAATQARDQQRQQLQADFEFIAHCNIGGESLSPEAIARLHALAEIPWQRHFDDRLGLSTAEAQRLQAARPQAPPLPASERLLADLAQHIVPWGERKPAVERGDPHNTHGFDMVLPAHRQNMGELHNLTVQRGTLTEEDRFLINDHMVQTLRMLRQLPWPRQLARVPDIASNHHETMDGTGYPRRLEARTLPVTDRVMAIADIFEALTAPDRPYKAPKTLSESLRIMAWMAKDQHIDAELFLYFLRSPVWLDYAQGLMQPEQIDAVDIEALARLVQPQSP